MLDDDLTRTDFYTKLDKSSQAGFKVPDMLGGNKDAWQMDIPDLTDAHIGRSSVISGHDMHAPGMALGSVRVPAPAPGMTGRAGRRGAIACPGRHGVHSSRTGSASY